MRHSYDAIVVGARCAGSPTAMLLARKGYRVLLVDKARFPSDTVSTHMIWPHAAELLDRWGLLERLAATGCPAIARQMIFDVGPFALKGGVEEANRGRGGFCPRRTILDKILVDAAVASGAELREELTVDGLVWSGDRVVGIRAHGRNGNAVDERAKIVIGADGVHSRVAEAVEPLHYDALPPVATYYYSYWSGFGAADVEQYVRPLQGVAVFPTHDGLTLLATVWPAARFKEIRTDIEGTWPRCRARSRRWRTGCRARAAWRSGPARRASPTTSVSRTAPGGHWSAMPATCAIPSRPRGSATPSSTPRP